MQESLFGDLLGDASDASDKELIQLADGCKLSYWPSFLTDQQRLFSQLQQSLNWQQNNLSIGGKTIAKPRLEVFYAEAGLQYSYSGSMLKTESFTPLLLELKHKVEAETGHSFNAVLCNYYRDGRDSVGQHADDEPELGKKPVVAALSFGAARRFYLKHNKMGERLAIDLAGGSLLLMHEGVQQYYQHGINKVKQAEPRISLTFRQIIVE
jgi:alkylated DNA repair dioxygenase AlkB